MGGTGKALEQIQPETTNLLPQDSNRCFEIKVGSKLSQGSDRWPVDVPGKSFSHQLLEVVGSISVDIIICEEQETSHSLPLHGRYLTSDLNQQERGCLIPTSHSSNKTMLGVVHGESNCTIS